MCLHGRMSIGSPASLAATSSSSSSYAKRRRRGQKCRRRRTDQHRRFEIAAHFLRLFVIHRQMMAWRQPAAQFLIAYVHRAVEGKIAHAGFRFAGEEHRRREIRRCVALRIRDQRQVGELAIDELIVRLRGLAQWNIARVGQLREAVPFPAKLEWTDAENFGETCSRPVDVGQYRQQRALDLVKEYRLAPLPVSGGGNRGELVFRIDLAPDLEQFTSRFQTFQIFAHRYFVVITTSRLIIDMDSRRSSAATTSRAAGAANATLIPRMGLRCTARFLDPFFPGIGDASWGRTVARRTG